MAFLGVPVGFGARQAMTSDRPASESVSWSLQKSLSPVASAVSHIFSFTVKTKCKALLAEIRTLQSDVSVLRASVQTILLA